MKDSQATVDRLEARVSELTEALALAQKHTARQAAQMQVGRELNQLFATTLEVPALVKQTAEIIKNGFSFYSVAVFLIDPTGYAVLHYTTTDSPQPHTANEARGLISQVAKTKQPVIVTPEKSLRDTGPLSHPRIALPLIADDDLSGILYLQGVPAPPFEQVDIDTLEPLTGPLATAIKKAQHYSQAIAERDKSKLLFEFSAALGTAHDFEAITKIAVSFADRWGAKTGNIHLLSDTGEVYFKSSYAERNDLDSFEKQELVRRILTEGLEAWVLETGRSALIPDTKLDDRWLPVQYADQAHTSRSIICSPITLERGRMRGAISFVHSQTNYFNQQDLALLDALAAQIGIALENTLLFKDIESNLQESQLVAQISSRLVGVSTIEQIYAALVEGVMKTGIHRCMLYSCADKNGDSLPNFSEFILASDIDTTFEIPDQYRQLNLADHPLLANLVESKKAFTIANISTQPGLAETDRHFLAAFRIKSTAIVPLVLRDRLTGWLFVQYRLPRLFDQHELTLYQMLCNQTVAAIENAQQRQQIHLALTETQILYRAGRVLAGTTNLKDILREALIDFLYGLGLDQGGITLLTPDRKYGELVAYVQNGQVEEFESFMFEIDENIPYQQLLLSGYPFTSYDVATDPRLVDYKNFNSEKSVKSLLEAPMIANGETIGWIGADAVDDHRVFSQREIDLVRAMADQIAITIQNHQLLKKSERQAEQLKTVAQVGNRVSQLTDLGVILSSTVDLIRDRFGFYHVSIFLLDETKKWAVVRASTGEVGQIMVQRPHRLEVGGQSIVGYVTGCAEPRIALDVGEDAVHFNNPLLPDTHSEMALPLIAGGQVIGALDVQSVKVDAFDEEDIETLQIMADQLTAALENARLLKSVEESETFLKAIINQIPDPIFIKNREHKWVVANQAFAAEVLRLPEEKIIGYSDYDYIPKEEADWFWEQDDKIFQTGQPNETEETITNVKGEHRILFTRKIPLFIQDKSEKPDYLIGVINDITERKQRELEREQLLEEIRRSLERTQALYRVSQVMTTATDSQTAFESVLGEYLQLLKLQQGSLILFDPVNNVTKAQARYIHGKPVTPRFELPAQEDLVFQRLRKNPKPLFIENAQSHPLVKASYQTRNQNQVKTMLFIPLIVRGSVMGSLGADSVEANRTFSHNDIEIGEAIVSQLSIRLESLQFLAEARHKTTLLQTAAEVSHAASSILDTDQLINTSVNLIRDKFELYYVGLFLVDEKKKWAVLRAGTGEAGRLQVEAGHKLEIGGGSMIGTSLQNREPRISMDVGGETQFFKNKYLPDTRSELALPLVTQGEAIGALTVQSVQPNAFSAEDITVLQTMADQLANTIVTARSFENTARARRNAEDRLRETIALQQFSQALAGTRHVNEILEILFDACTKVIGFDYIQVSLVDKKQQIKAVAGVGVSESQLRLSTSSLNSGDMMADIIRTGKTEIISGWDERLHKSQFEAQKQHNWLRVFTPITLRQNRVGLVEAGFFNTTKQATLESEQTQLLQAFIDQTALALDNAQRYEVSRRAAQRETIIREITGKIQSAVDIDDILKTTVTELSQLLDTSRASVRLAVTQAGGSLPGRQTKSATNGPSQSTQKFSG